jgi:hypothetical protein
VTLKIHLTKPEVISFGQSGANIGIVIGRAIEAETEMGLEILSSRSFVHEAYQGARSKKDLT